ncbi:MAG: hypothetical protein LBM01_03290 [Christensenellaceae bacterium]|jgi:sRNA-binding protein|nr:hypothetical protein [Christensenellaceae bacterium]
MGRITQFLVAHAKRSVEEARERVKEMRAQGMSDKEILGKIRAKHTNEQPKPTETKDPEPIR